LVLYDRDLGVSSVAVLRDEPDVLSERLAGFESEAVVEGGVKRCAKGEPFLGSIAGVLVCLVGVDGTPFGADTGVSPFSNAAAAWANLLLRGVAGIDVLLSVIGGAALRVGTLLSSIGCEPFFADSACFSVPPAARFTSPSSRLSASLALLAPAVPSLPCAFNLASRRFSAFARACASVSSIA
jgi:hypothetical protein